MCVDANHELIEVPFTCVCSHCFQDLIRKYFQKFSVTLPYFVEHQQLDGKEIAAENHSTTAVGFFGWISIATGSGIFLLQVFHGFPYATPNFTLSCFLEHALYACSPSILLSANPGVSALPSIPCFRSNPLNHLSHTPAFRHP